MTRTLPFAQGVYVLYKLFNQLQQQQQQQQPTAHFSKKASIKSMRTLRFAC